MNNNNNFGNNTNNNINNNDNINNRNNNKNNRNNNLNNNNRIKTNKINKNNRSAEQKVYEEALKDVIACQEGAQVFSVLATHCRDVNLTISAVHRAMEMNKVCGLFKLFIINNSPSLLASVALIELALKKYQDDLYKLEGLPEEIGCKKIVRKTIEINKKLLKSIRKMRNTFNMN